MSNDECPKMPPARMYHRADKINDKGGVSALCFTKPRTINMRRESWTMTDASVTCPKCMALMKGRRTSQTRG